MIKGSRSWSHGILYSCSILGNVARSSHSGHERFVEPHNHRCETEKSEGLGCNTLIMRTTQLSLILLYNSLSQARLCQISRLLGSTGPKAEYDRFPT